ncbi:MAG: tetratricopeptide repeat protein [Bacteroidota bacterium]
MKHLILIIGFFTIISLPVPASGNSDKEVEQKIKKVEKYVEKEAYHKALDILVELVIIESDNAKLNYYTGLCYYQSGKKLIAEEYFNKAMTDEKVKLQVNNFKKIMEDEKFME